MQAKREAGLLTRRMMLQAEHPELGEEELQQLAAEIDGDS